VQGLRTTLVQLRSSTALVWSGDCEGNTIVTGYAHQAYTTERSMQSLERVAEALGNLIIHTVKPAARPDEELPDLQSVTAPTELHRAFLCGDTLTHSYNHSNQDCKHSR
jgi:hypothetical protein